MKKSQMTPDDQSYGYAKTSLTMTRSMAEDIGMKVRSILENATNNKLGLSYVEWQEFISQCWSDKIWIRAVNKAITKAANNKLNLNKNSAFITLILEKTYPELKIEMEKTHPIAKMALKDNVGKKPPDPEKERKYSDLWLTPDELRKRNR